jgi:hypothetical protein
MRPYRFMTLGSLIAFIILVSTIHDLPKLHFYPIVPLYIVDAFELAFLALVQFTGAIMVISWLSLFFFCKNTLKPIKERAVFIAVPVVCIGASLLMMLTAHALTSPNVQFTFLPMNQYDFGSLIWNIIAVTLISVGIYILAITAVNSLFVNGMNKSELNSKIKWFFAVPILWRLFSIILPLPTNVFLVSGILAAIVVIFIGLMIDIALRKLLQQT